MCTKRIRYKMESWGIFTFYNRRLLMPEGGGSTPPIRVPSGHGDMFVCSGVGFKGNRSASRVTHTHVILSFSTQKKS